MSPLDCFSKERATDRAAERTVTGREGSFVLLTNRPLTAEEVIELYRARNRVEGASRDLKHGMDRRPAGCTKEKAIKGGILISFPALFCISTVRFLHPEHGGKTAESICEGLGSFSLTALAGEGGRKRRMFSNFVPLIRLLRSRIGGQIGKNSEGSDVLGRLLTPFSRKWKRERHLRTTFNSSGSQVNDQA